jgi:hypothetical protein
MVFTSLLYDDKCYERSKHSNNNTDLGYNVSTELESLNPTTGEWLVETDMPLLLSSADIHLASFYEDPGSSDDYTILHYHYFVHSL